jgi:hypothetical protein
MSRTDAVVASSRYVRIAVASCLVAAVPVVLGFQLFVSHLGQTSRELVRAGECEAGGCALSPAVVRTVTELESQGLNCRSKPALTDRVVVEWTNHEADVVDFAAALRASSKHQGWIRQYCLPQ